MKIESRKRKGEMENIEANKKLRQIVIFVELDHYSGTCFKKVGHTKPEFSAHIS